MSKDHFSGISKKDEKELSKFYEEIVHSSTVDKNYLAFKEAMKKISDSGPVDDSQEE